MRFDSRRVTILIGRLHETITVTYRIFRFYRTLRIVSTSMAVEIKKSRRELFCRSFNPIPARSLTSNELHALFFSLRLIYLFYVLRCSLTYETTSFRTCRRWNLFYLFSQTDVRSGIFQAWLVEASKRRTERIQDVFSRRLDNARLERVKRYFYANFESQSRSARVFFRCVQ